MGGQVRANACILMHRPTAVQALTACALLTALLPDSPVSGDAVCAGVRCVMVVTQRPQHAFEVLRDLPLAELQLYDGVLAVRIAHPCAVEAC